MKYDLSGRAISSETTHADFYAFLCASGQYLCSKITHTESVDHSAIKITARDLSDVKIFFGEEAFEQAVFVQSGQGLGGA